MKKNIINKIINVALETSKAWRNQAMEIGEALSHRRAAMRMKSSI